MIVVEAEQVRTDVVADPTPLPLRGVDFHAIRGAHRLSGEADYITIEIHDPTGGNIPVALLLHFKAEDLMKELARAMMHNA